MSGCVCIVSSLVALKLSILILDLSVFFSSLLLNSPANSIDT